MNRKAQLCYTDETFGRQMLVTFIEPNQSREIHMISTSKTEHLKDKISLLEDGDGVTYISYRALGKPGKKVYIGWSYKEPIPGKPLDITGFGADEIDEEILDGRKPDERCIHLNILRNLKKGVLKYGNVWITDADVIGEDATAVIQLR